ncbi:unnamed protein product [Caenorhabditis auriculariae]|uniref:Guanine nucleotide-binding protein subunit gamma n=1 Tax=Caenorhabditis auriculariae TaxID=2777116 RepID=A0A8S1HJ74_9PELO|nr:unnamed protein product [Caenorhabditis auriculariae]
MESRRQGRSSSNLDNKGFRSISACPSRVINPQKTTHGAAVVHSHKLSAMQNEYPGTFPWLSKKEKQERKEDEDYYLKLSQLDLNTDYAQTHQHQKRRRQTEKKREREYIITVQTTDVEMERAKAITNQLQLEVKINREKVSVVSKDLIEFCEQNKEKDVLVTGVTDELNNPFHEKKTCSLL